MARSDGPVTTYRQLDVWQRSIELVEEAYRLAKLLPADERFGLVSQLQRAAVSISLNIAEGWGRTHKGDYLHHLSMAKGSLAEVETLLIIALRLEYIDKEAGKRSWELAQEVGKMLTTMIANMRQPGARKPSTAPDQA